MKINRGCSMLILFCTLIFFSCTKDNHEEEPDNWTQPKLAGTQWKLAGVMDSQTGALTQASPKGCEQCYTLAFDSDTTGMGYSASNRLEVTLQKKTSTWKNLTAMEETDDGDLFLEVIRLASSYDLKEGELKFFYEKSGKKYYLLYKPSDNEAVTYPVEITATDFALPSGWSWKYTSTQPGVYIVNSQEALAKYLSGNGTPVTIDFDQYSLLFAFGPTTSNVLQQSSQLTQVSDSEFRLDVDVELGDATVMEFWTVAVLIPKIPLCSVVQLNVKQHNNSDGAVITVAKGEFRYREREEGFCKQDAVISHDNYPDTIISTDNLWKALKSWLKGGFNYSSALEFLDESAIDFSSYQLLVVYDKIRTNCGWSIDITDVRENSDNLTVTVRNLKKGNGTGGKTQPFHIVKIPVSKKKIVFEWEVTEIGMPFTVYSLEGTDCKWQNLFDFSHGIGITHKFIIVNSKEEMQEYISCTTGDVPAIDFSKYSLVLASGQCSSAIGMPSVPIEDEFTQVINRVITAFTLNTVTNRKTLNITMFNTFILEQDLWTVSILVPKIADKSNVDINVLQTGTYFLQPHHYYY